MDTAGKVALVTGAARRVGRAIALSLAEAGIDVAIHYHTSADEAQRCAEEIRRLDRRAVCVKGDLAESDTPRAIVDKVVEKMGGLDILVNNASVFDRSPVGQAEQVGGDVWERIFRVNAVAPDLLAKWAAPLMQRAGAGRIVNLTDVLADRPIRGYAAYCASKAALVSLTRSLAWELAPEITVNAVAPGIAVFPESYDQALRDKLVSRVPLKRVGTPEEVAAVVRFLVTAGDYITGQVIAVDGGRSIVP